MSRFKVGDYVRLNYHTAHDGQTGLVRDIIPNITDDERFQPYIVEFRTLTGPVSGHYLEYELQHPSDVEPGVLVRGPSLIISIHD